MPVKLGGVGSIKSAKRWVRILLAALWLILPAVDLAGADPPPAAGQIYTWQVDDSLSRLAEKYYDEIATWPAIVMATNGRVALDGRFDKIRSPAEIQPGQFLWLPGPDEVETLLAQYPDVQPLSPALLAEFENYVEAARTRYDIPGAAVVLVRGNRIVFAQGFGVRKLGGTEPVTPDTVFAVGSTTKAMSSLLVASLVDEGLLEWDQPVRDVWPDFTLSDPSRTAQLQLRHMLSMGSGLPRRDLVWSGTGLTAEELMESLADLPVYGDLGQWYDYNNQVFATGAYVAILAAGGKYGHLRAAYVDQLRSRVFEPIGMSTATFSVEQLLANPNHATPHDYNLYGEVSPTAFHTDESVTPAGGASANALDLAKFLMTQMNGGLSPEGRRVVSAENLAETHRPQTRITDELSYGMGWYIEDYRGVELLWHDGNVFGFKASLAMIPAADLGLVVLSNSIMSITFNDSVQYRLVELMFDLPPEAEAAYDRRWEAFEQAIAKIRATVSPTVDPVEVAPFLGQYTGCWQVELRADRLYATCGPYEWHLLQAGPEEFIVNNGYGIGLELYLKQEPESGRVTMSFRLPTGEVGHYELLAE
jgi:CubicO group peptidase (beta-lactamase class C family)